MSSETPLRLCSRAPVMRMKSGSIGPSSYPPAPTHSRRVYAVPIACYHSGMSSGRRPGRCLVKMKSEDKLGKKDFSTVDVGEIHQLANTSGHDLVTVHVYARPLRDLNVYCPNTGEIDKVTLRYSLEDDFA